MVSKYWQISVVITHIFRKHVSSLLQQNLAAMYASTVNNSMGSNNVGVITIATMGLIIIMEWLEWM